MIRYYNAIINSKGDILPGYKLRVLSSTGSVVNIKQDSGGTNFDETNLCPVDENGNALFYWTPATGQVLQHLDPTGSLVFAIADFADQFVATNLSVELGSFTGTTIPDNASIKGALQALETPSEAATAALGVTGSNLGTFTSPLIDDDETVKGALESLASATLVSGGGSFSQQAVIAYDNFDRADGFLNGQAPRIGDTTWDITGPGAADVIIENGSVYASDTAADANFYAHLDAPGGVETMAAVVCFETRANAANSVTSRGPTIVLLASSSTTLENMLHAQFRQNGWIIDYRIGGVWTLGIADGAYWMEPDVEYQIALSVDRSNNSYRITVAGAAGVLVDTGWTVYAPIASLPSLVKPAWQIGLTVAPATDAYRPALRECFIGAFNDDGLVTTYGAAPAVNAINSGFAEYRTPRLVIADTNYVRLFEASTLFGFYLSGTLSIHAVSPAGVFAATYTVLNYNGFANPLITAVGPEILFGTLPITIRLSNDANNAVIDVAFSGAAANNVTLNCRFEGSAVVGNFGRTKSNVSALTGAQTSYVPTPAQSSNEASGVVSGAGWYSAISQSSFAAGGSIQGLFEVAYVPDNDAFGTRFYVVAEGSQFGIQPMMIFPMLPNAGTIEKLRISFSGTTVRVDAYLTGGQAPGVLTVKRIAGEGTPVVASVGSVLAGGDFEQTLINGSPQASYWDAVNGFRVAGVVAIAGVGAAISKPTGGSVIDVEARAAIDVLIDRARAKTPGIAT